MSSKPIPMAGDDVTRTPLSEVGQVVLCSCAPRRCEPRQLVRQSIATAYDLFAEIVVGCAGYSQDCIVITEVALIKREFQSACISLIPCPIHIP